jgi:uncharacterized integral membrane protein (TIGR00697 family)
MFNSLLFLGWALLGLFVLLLLFRFFGRSGLIGFIGAAVVVMNILVTKGMIIFGVDATGGNVLYASIFLATDLLSEYYGGREARRAVLIGFFCSVFALVAASVTLAFRPAPWDWAQPSLEAIFTPVARIVAGSMIAYFLSQNLDTYLYDFIRRRWKGLWLRNNGSTWLSQLVDTLVFCTVALLGTMPRAAWGRVVLSTYLLKIVVAAVDTPFIYLSRLWKPRELKISSAGRDEPAGVSGNAER